MQYRQHTLVPRYIQYKCGGEHSASTAVLWSTVKVKVQRSRCNPMAACVRYKLTEAISKAISQMPDTYIIISGIISQLIAQSP